MSNHDDHDNDNGLEHYEVRVLRADDLAAMVRIDAHSFGRPRPEYYKLKLRNALEDTGVRISLAAEQDGVMVGFLMGSVYYGDYGQPEPVATIEVINVLPDYRGLGVGRALWAQFTRNVKAMRIDKVQTQVDWSNWDLLTFLQRQGFTPASRVCLERSLDFERDE